MSARSFFDTNILVYTDDKGSPGEAIWLQRSFFGRHAGSSRRRWCPNREPVSLKELEFQVLLHRASDKLVRFEIYLNLL
jgi:hypothetical protein